jgi:hypothetical protein
MGFFYSLPPELLPKNPPARLFLDLSLRSAQVTTKRVNTATQFGVVKLIPWLIGAGFVVLIAVPVAINTSQRTNLPGEVFPDQGNAHIAEGDTSVDYNSDPPTSGPHWETMASWGSYDFVVPDQVLLHNLEDGGVILWYAHGSREENRVRISQLEEVTRGFERVIIAPREDLEAPFAVTAWGRRQLFSDINQTEMRAFIEAFESIDHHG